MKRLFIAALAAFTFNATAADMVYTLEAQGQFERHNMVVPDMTCEELRADIGAQFDNVFMLNGLNIVAETSDYMKAGYGSIVIVTVKFYCTETN